MDKNSKLKTGVNIFQRCFDKKKISKYWATNNKNFIGRKRNLWYENSNLRKDKEKLLDENDDLFDENNQLKNEKYDLLDKNNQLRNNVDEINKKLNRKKEKYEALKKENKALYGENENLREENKNLSEQNSCMRNLLSYFGIFFNEDDKQIKNNTENQQMFNHFMLPFGWLDDPTNNSLFNDINKSSVGQEHKPISKASSQPLQKE